MRYVYRGDRMTDPALAGMRCDPVQWLSPRSYAGCPPVCVRGKNGSMLVVDEHGRRHVVLGRQLRVQK